MLSLNKSKLFFCGAAFTVFITLPAAAKHYDTGAPTYPIAEQDARQTIQTILQEKAANGELARWQLQQIAAAQAAADRPTPVPNVTRALENKSWLFNPAIIASDTIRDTKGNILATVGAPWNPLDVVTWTTTLIFYDGDDAEQVKWVQQIDQQCQGKDKLILVNGSVNTQSEQFKKRVFFDQGGRLTQKFNIQHVPATVRQEGKLLRITEIKI